MTIQSLDTSQIMRSCTTNQFNRSAFNLMSEKLHLYRSQPNTAKSFRVLEEFLVHFCVHLFTN